jgi:hypothetical protein
VQAQERMRQHAATRGRSGSDSPGSEGGTDSPGRPGRVSE